MAYGFMVYGFMALVLKLSFFIFIHWHYYHSTARDHQIWDFHYISYVLASRKTIQARSILDSKGEGMYLHGFLDIEGSIGIRD